MRYIKPVLVQIFILALFTNFVYAQPKLPKEDIPKEIDGTVRKEILKLYSKNLLVRRDAIENLGAENEKAKAAIPYLVDMLSSKEKIVRITETAGLKTHIMHFIAEDIAKALANIGKESVAPLIESLKKDDNNVKAYAAYSLGLLKAEGAVKPLISNLDAESTIVKKLTVKALEDITDKDFGEDKKKWEEYLNSKK